MNQGFVGGGVRMEPTYGSPGFARSGRPLRTDTGVARSGQPLYREDPRASGCVDERALRVGSAYARDAQLEYASVPAFLQLAAELSAHAAPAELVSRALAAGRDEVAHARACATLASRHLRQRVVPHVHERSARAAGGPSGSRAPGRRKLARRLLDGERRGRTRGRRGARRERCRSAGTAAQSRRRRAAPRRAGLGGPAIRARARWRRGQGSGVRAARRGDSAPGDGELEPEGFEADGRLGARARDAVADRQRALGRARLERMLRAV